MTQFAGAETIARKVKNPKGAIVYAHSFMGRFQQKDALMRHYADYDFYALNLPGHGSSPLVADVQAYPGYGLALVQCFIEFHDVKNAVFMGHSLGGGMVAALNSLMPERIALNIVETPACGVMRENAEIIGKLVPETPEDVDAVFKAMYADPEKTFHGHYEQAKKTAFSGTPSAYRAYAPTIKRPIIDMNGAVFDAGFAAAKAPTLVILGENDGIIPADKTKKHLAAVNPRLEFAVIKGAGHVPFHEQREAFLALTDAFIQKHYAKNA